MTLENQTDITNNTKPPNDWRQTSNLQLATHLHYDDKHNCHHALRAYTIVLTFESLISCKHS